VDSEAAAADTARHRDRKKGIRGGPSEVSRKLAAAARVISRTSIQWHKNEKNKCTRLNYRSRGVADSRELS
jgi:hypothetical protein